MGSQVEGLKNYNEKWCGDYDCEPQGFDNGNPAPRFPKPELNDNFKVSSLTSCNGNSAGKSTNSSTGKVSGTYTNTGTATGTYCSTGRGTGCYASAGKGTGYKLVKNSSLVNSRTVENNNNEPTKTLVPLVNDNRLIKAINLTSRAPLTLDLQTNNNTLIQGLRQRSLDEELVEADLTWIPPPITPDQDTLDGRFPGTESQMSSPPTPFADGDQFIARIQENSVVSQAILTPPPTPFADRTYTQDTTRNKNCFGDQRLENSWGNANFTLASSRDSLFNPPPTTNSRRNNNIPPPPDFS